MLGGSFLEVRCCLLYVLDGRYSFTQTWSSQFFFCLAIKHRFSLFFFSFVWHKAEVGDFSGEALIAIALAEECLSGLNTVWQRLLEMGYASCKDGRVCFW